MQNLPQHVQVYCTSSNSVVYQTPLINLTGKYAGYRVLDQNSNEYQMEAFIYTCVILLFYALTTGAFMVKFILQSREPWEHSDGDHAAIAASSYLAQVAKLREREVHRKLVERQARQDVKLRVINHLNHLTNSTTISMNTENVDASRTNSRCRNSITPSPVAASVRSGSDGLIDVRPILKSCSPINYHYQQQDADIGQQQPLLGNEHGETGLQSTGACLLLPLWAPGKRKQSSNHASHQSSWRCNGSPQMATCVPRLSPRAGKRESLDTGDNASIV
jgi:hypothetical protein